MRFFLLDRRNKLIFLALIKYIIEDIKKSTIYITLSINNYKVKNSSTNISIL